MGLLENWFKSTKGSSKKSRKRSMRRRLRRFRGEQLEDRSMLTATVFVDFGEGFTIPSGESIPQLKTTAGTIAADISSGGLQGPNMIGGDITSSTPITMRRTVDWLVGDNIDYNQDSTVDIDDYYDFKADVLDLIERAYAPFNIDIVEAASATVADAQDELADNNGLLVGKNDTYLFITPVGFEYMGSLYSYGAVNSTLGQANSYDIAAAQNTRDDTAVIFADYVFDYVQGTTGLDDTDIDTAIAQTAVHESGHGLGLEHIDLGASADDLLLGRSEVMGTPAQIDALKQPTFFTRASLTAVDPLTSSYSPADRLGNDPDIGYKSGIQYITGTGANDVITLTWTSNTTFSVSVKSYDDSSNLILTTSYTGSGSLGDIRIYGGMGDDDIIIKNDWFTNYTPTATISVWGMDGEDWINFSGTAAYTQAVDNSVTSANVKVNYAPDSPGEEDGAIEAFTMNQYDDGTWTYVTEIHSLYASTEFILPMGGLSVSSVKVYAPSGNDTNFIQSSSGQFQISEEIGGSLQALPGKITYGGTTTFRFYGNTGDDTLYINKLSDFLSVNFIGGDGDDSLSVDSNTSYDKRYTLDSYYSNYNRIMLEFETSPGNWVSQQGTLRFNLQGDTIENLQVNGNSDDILLMNDLLLGTEVTFDSGTGSELIVDLNGETVAASGSIGLLNYVQYTDGTTTYMPIYYSNTVMLSTV